MFKIDQLDQTKACEIPHEFEVTDDVTGQGTGIFISVIGEHATAVTEFSYQYLQKRRIDEAMALKSDPRGKRLHVVPIEDDVDFGLRAIANRIVGWCGIEDPFTPENAVKLCKLYPSLKDQAGAKSIDLKNFPISGLVKSLSTSASMPG